MPDPVPANPSKVRVFFARLFSTLLLWLVVTGVFMSANVWLFMALMSLLGFLGIWEYFRMAREGGVPSQPKWGLIISAFYLGVLAWLLGSRGHAALDLMHAVDAALITLHEEMERKQEGKESELMDLLIAKEWKSLFNIPDVKVA